MAKKVFSGIRLSCLGFVFFAVAAVLLATRCEGATAPDPRDSNTSESHYQVTAQGKTMGYFSEAYNMGSETEIVDKKEVDSKGIVQLIKVPGGTRIFEVTLKRGTTSNMELVGWRKLVVDGDLSKARKDVVITMYNKTGDATAIWNLKAAWPCSLIYNPLEGATASSTVSNVGMESITLVSDDIVRVK